VLAAPLIASRGSRQVTVGAGTALCAAVVLPALAGSWLALTGALLLVGVADAVMDVAMNANAVAVERRYKRTVLNSMHAVWSVGALTGALTGSAAVGLDIGPGAHLATAAAVLLVALWACSPHLLRADGGAAPVAGRAGLPRPTPALGALGAVALCAAVIEGAAADWGALHLAAQEGAPPGGFAFAGFCAAMIAGRVVGDRVVEAVGAATTARGGAALAAAGYVAAATVAHPALVIASFAVVGLGVATLYPLAFSAAGHLPGQASGGAIAAVSLVARLGFVAGPTAVGMAAGLLTLSGALLGVAGVAGVVVLLAGALAPRYAQSRGSSE